MSNDSPARVAGQPQRSSSLSYKGQQQQQLHRGQQQQPSQQAQQRTITSSPLQRQQPFNEQQQQSPHPRRSPLLSNSGAEEESLLAMSDDIPIPLQTRPASFAGPPSSRYMSRFTNSDQQQHPTQAAHDGSNSQYGNYHGSTLTKTMSASPSTRQQSSFPSTSMYSQEVHNPTPSTSKMPYEASSTSQHNQQAYNHPHTANPTISSQYRHYTSDSQEQPQRNGSPSSNSMRNRQDSGNNSRNSMSPQLAALNDGFGQSGQQRPKLSSNDSGSSSGNGTTGQQQQQLQLQNYAPRRSRSVESNNEPGSSPSLRQRGIGENASGTSSRHLNPPGGGGPSTSMSNSTSGGNRRTSQLCAKCNQAMTGQFVRALGTVFHLDCFRCQDCNKIVAAKFFPVDGPDGKQYPLCETDYFRRLSLICAKCGMALRGSYITALDMKFHVEHFTCSVCPTVFGPQDSYYEHGGHVYCHFHYSTRFAVKCTGCRTAILKQFVEINRNNVDEHWHPECYMIHKFWNIKLVPSSRKQIEASPVTLQAGGSGDAAQEQGETEGGSPSLKTADLASTAISKSVSSSSAASSKDWTVQEKLETAQTLRDKQKHVEAQVYRIWTVLSTFEESSAACISEMLRHVSNGHYLDGVKMAEKFVLHVETLFAAIDDLNAAFRHLGSKEIPHVREARMLCKKVVNFFSLLSHTHESGARKMGITQDLLSLVTGLAHYLKILIRIALTAALKLERDYSSKTALSHFLARLDRLCRDPEIVKAANSPISAVHGTSATNGADTSKGAETVSAVGMKSRACGYKSLIRPGGSFINQIEGEAITDLCEACHLTVEEECVRFGTNLRWHLQCLSCSMCQRHASKEKDPAKLAAMTRQRSEDSGEEKKVPLYLKEFRIELFDKRIDEGVTNKSSGRSRPSAGRLFCSECPSGSVQDGFEYVTRLEQYAFLLCVALNKLYYLLKRRGVLASSPPALPQSGKDDDERSIHETYRDSVDIKRMKSVNLDRKISTTARLAQRLTVIESPHGTSATAQAGIDGGQQQRSEDQQVASIRHVQSSALPSSQQTSPYQGGTSPQLSATSPAAPTQQQKERSASDQSQHQQYMQQQQQYQQQAYLQQQQQHGPSHNDMLAPDASQRPGYSRTTTAIRVVEDQPPIEHGAFRDSDPLGSERSPTQDEDGITLADLHQVMEAEQAREQRGAAPRHSQMLLSELSALEYFIVKHAAAITLASDLPPYRDFAIAQLDELLDIIDAKKNNFWGKLFKGSSKDKKEVKKKGTFGVPLEVLVDRHGTDSMLGAGPGSVRIPTFVDDAITAMKQMDLSVEGIFRKNGNIRRLKELAENIDRDPDSVNLADDNPVQIAALLKKFLRDMPDPLLTFRLQHLYLATQHIENDEDRRKILHLIMCLMPKYHRDTMEVLFVFLKWVASFSHVDEETGSKMDLQNLATVICPNILYSKGKDASKDESFLGIRAVAEMLQYQDELFTVPQELTGILADQDLFSNPAELSSKDILKKAEVHLRERQRFRERNGGGEYPGNGGAAYRGGFRGEVKQTHPHYHAAFAPPSAQLPPLGLGSPYEGSNGQYNAYNHQQQSQHPAHDHHHNVNNNNNNNSTMTSPRYTSPERPLSWQAVPQGGQSQAPSNQQLQPPYQYQSFPTATTATNGASAPQHQQTTFSSFNGPAPPANSSSMLSPSSNTNHRQQQGQTSVQSQLHQQHQQQHNLNTGAPQAPASYWSQQHQTAQR